MSGKRYCLDCGAALSPDSEGRFAQCVCGGVAVLAAGESEQRHPAAMFELGNIDAFLVSLARTLSTALGRRATIRVDGTKVIHFELHLGADVFVARREGSELVGEHTRSVDGGAPETRTHALERWVELLKKALAVYATENIRAAQARGITVTTPAAATPPRPKAPKEPTKAPKEPTKAPKAAKKPAAASSKKAAPKKPGKKG